MVASRRSHSCPTAIASNARIAGEHDEEVSRSIGQRAEDRRLHPEVGGVAQQERRQDLGAVGLAKFPNREGELVAHPDGRVRRHQPELVPDRVGESAACEQLF